MLISEDQIQELYEINDDPNRKEFLDELFSFMQKRGTPINRLPIMAKSVLDLYELYNLVIARGGLVDVINKKLWQEIIKGLHLPSSITSAAFTLRTQYMKYLYPYECEKKNLSTPAELQAAIDGNRREGRRSSYGQYETIHNQMQINPITRQSLQGGMQQISPLALVTHVANNQQVQAAAVAAAHHRLMTPSLFQQELEQRVMEYLKTFKPKKEENAMINGSSVMGMSPHHQQQHESQSPEINANETYNHLDNVSRFRLWQMYHNSSPPATLNTLTQDGENVNSAGGSSHDVSEAQRSEALNLSDSPLNPTTIKREREREPDSDVNEHSDFHLQPTPAKRTAFPASFYLRSDMHNLTVAAAAANFHHKRDRHDSDAEVDEDEGEHNTTQNFSNDNERQHLNGSTLQIPKRHSSRSSVHNDKSDDSAIENSPSTSAASGVNNEISPLSSKKIHLSKQTPQNCSSTANISGAELSTNNITTGNSISVGPLELLNSLSGMQFRVTPNGTNSNGAQELLVNLELNGIKFSGSITANNSNPSTETSDKDKNNSTIGTRKIEGEHCQSPTNIIDNSNQTRRDLLVAMDAMENTNELSICDTETQPHSSTSTAMATATPSAANQNICSNTFNDDDVTTT